MHKEQSEPETTKNSCQIQLMSLVTVSSTRICKLLARIETKIAVCLFKWGAFSELYDSQRLYSCTLRTERRGVINNIIFNNGKQLYLALLLLFRTTSVFPYSLVNLELSVAHVATLEDITCTNISKCKLCSYSTLSKHRGACEGKQRQIYQ